MEKFLIHTEENKYIQLSDGTSLDTEMSKKENMLNQRQIKYSTKYEPDVIEYL